MSSSEHDFQKVTRSSDGAANWAADTDPVGPVTPELALVDPALAGGGEINREVTMSSLQFGDGSTLDAPEAAHAPPEAPSVAPLQPVNQVSPAPELTAPVPAEPTPAVPVADMRDVPLGTLVFRAGLLAEERLEEALHEGMKTGKRLGEILLERGWVSENDLGRLLAGQKGLPFVELDPAAIDQTAPPLLHPEKARLHGALPIGFQGGVPVVAVVDPSNDLVVENVRRALGCEPVLVVAGRDALSRAIEHAYRGLADPVVAPPPAPEPYIVEPAPVVEPVAPVLPVLEPVAIDEPVSPVVEPVAMQTPNGDGLWLGQAETQPVVSETPIEAPAPAPQAEIVQPTPEPVAPVAQPVAAEPTPEPEASWSVVLRLADGERIDVGSFAGEAEAVEGAHGVVAQIAADGSWPFFAGRFIRPETIVSVDLTHEDADRWLGSSARAAAWSQSPPA